ncbi:uncharacterized protein LOC124139128 isoform X2 [Haliotis rufescens]|uniref:uncharacterized protein LOC124139128 isoform X2 n=1 Tax=Haliotis rufescens TaxID=6454 RepID=UPI001EAFA42E|nr:uncharacterized protein LOC124139128 isoform X2 [Haliotis rufescens]
MAYSEDTEIGHACTVNMLKEQLLNREDLLESLDTEPIFDYLLQHGVLDKTAIDGICNEKTTKERNTALLQHLEGTGNNAVALFINALRQSGQLHLASTLDTSQRIKPIYGTGYWEKQRHKGQVMVKIQVKSVKVLVPNEETPDKRSRTREIYDVKMTPRRLHKSYDNMLMLDPEEQPTPKPIRIVDYPYAKDEEEEDESIKPKKSCWCMCFPMFRSRRKTIKEKKYIEKGGPGKGSQNSQSPSREKLNPRPLSPTKQKMNSPSKGSNSGLTNPSDKALNGNSHSRTNSPLKDSRTEYKNSVNDQRTHSKRDHDNKENMDPVIMRYNDQLELVELKRYSHKSSPKRHASSNSVMCEKWKHDGKHYEEKSSEFYGLFDRDLKNSCIKYFEQDRGTLILQIFSDNQGITVFNICMTLDQVSNLHEDYTGGKLQQKLHSILMANGTIERLDVLDLDLAITIEDNQFDEATQELT